MEITNKVSDIITLALDNSHTKASQVAASKLLTWFNIIRKDFWNAIASETKEKYFFEIWKTPGIIAENGEYPLPLKDDSSDGMKKFIGVQRMQNYSDIDYIPCRPVDVAALPKDWAWYLENQPSNDPVYFLADESVFIAPNYKAEDFDQIAPTENLMIKFLGTLKCRDLIATDGLDKVKIDVDFAWIIALGMEEYIYKARGKRQEATESKQSYEYEKSVAIDKLSNRDQGEMLATMPDESNTQYGQ